MKFLCVPCDSPMKLQSVGPPERGSLSVVYSCPECGYEMAMLTNAYETQVVQSLGVRIGPDRLRAEGASAADVQRTGTGSSAMRAPSMGGIIAGNGHLLAPAVASPGAPGPLSGPIRTPSDWTTCVSYGLVSIAIS